VGAAARAPGRRGHPAGQCYGDGGSPMSAADSEGAASAVFRRWGQLRWSPAGSAGPCSTGGEGVG
jgi:hypothetical protein